MAADDGKWESWTTLPLAEIEEVADVVLSDTPVTRARVCIMLAELAARVDVADPIVQGAIAQCWDFIEPETKTYH